MMNSLRYFTLCLLSCTLLFFISSCRIEIAPKPHQNDVESPLDAKDGGPLKFPDSGPDNRYNPRNRPTNCFGERFDGSHGQAAFSHRPSKRGVQDYTYCKQTRIYNEQEHWSYDAGNTYDAGAPSPDDSSPPPPSGRTETVEEADLYKMQGTLLYYLNTYKGLTIFDLSDRQRPRKLASLGVYGKPMEMFFDKNTAYVLVKDALYLREAAGRFKFYRRNTSQLISIDISDPYKPRIYQQFDVVGSLKEGVSRKVGDVIYLTSAQYATKGWSYERGQRQERLIVYSFDVSNPKAIRKLQELDLLKQANAHQKGGAYLHHTTITATSNALMVTENWQVRDFPKDAQGKECQFQKSLRRTVVNFIDISDPKGKIRTHARFALHGHITDQFKQSYRYDTRTKRGIYYGVLQRNEWRNAQGHCHPYQTTVSNVFVTVDVTDGTKVKVLDSLYFGKPRETVRGTLFDKSRHILYAITAIETDPFYVISFKDPSKLKILSSIEGLSGDINLFRPIAGGQYMLGIGRDTTGHCTGFDDFGRRRTRVAVSIFDVRDLRKAKLVQRKCLGFKDARWTTSSVNVNRDQAHKQIAMFNDRNANLIAVPLSFYESNRTRTGWHRGYRTAVGLMRWDLKVYDPSKNEKQQKVLENMGTVIHKEGQVQRILVLPLPTKGSQTRRTMITLSQNHMALTDIEDTRKPLALGSLEIAPFVRATYRFGNYLVEHIEVKTNRDAESHHHMLRVKKIGDTPLSQAPILATEHFGNVQSVIKWKSSLIVVQKYLNIKTSVRYNRAYYHYNKSQLIRIDFKTPQQPKRLLTQTLPYRFRSSTSSGQCTGCDHQPMHQSAQWFTNDDGILYTGQYSGRTSGYLLWLELSKPDTVQHQPLGILLTVRSAIQEDSNNVYITTKNTDSYTAENYHYRFESHYVHHLSYRNGSWAVRKGYQIPGTLLSIVKRQQQQYFLTRDHVRVYDKGKLSNQTRERLLWSKAQADGRVALLDWYTLEDWQRQHQLLRGNRLYLGAKRSYRYWSKHTQQSPEQGSQYLLQFNMAKDRFQLEHSHLTRIPSFRMIGLHRDSLFMDIPQVGILAVDLSIPAAPKGLHFLRTWGYTTQFTLDQTKAWFAVGHYGVFRMDLTQSSIPPL